MVLFNLLVTGAAELGFGDSLRASSRESSCLAEELELLLDGNNKDLGTETEYRMTSVDFAKLLSFGPDPFGASKTYKQLVFAEIRKIVEDIENGRISHLPSAATVRVEPNRWKTRIFVDWYDGWLEHAIAVFWGVLITGMLQQIRLGNMSEDFAEVNFTPRFASMISKGSDNLQLLALAQDLVGIANREDNYIAELRLRTHTLVHGHLEHLSHLPTGIWWTPEVISRCI